MRACCPSGLADLSDDLPLLDPFPFFNKIDFVVPIDRHKFFGVAKDDEISIPPNRIARIDDLSRTGGFDGRPGRRGEWVRPIQGMRRRGVAIGNLAGPTNRRQGTEDPKARPSGAARGWAAPR